MTGATSRWRLRFLTDWRPVMSYHFAWPGYGHIAQTGDGFHYYHYPEPMQMLL
jgi:hypothetical protein